ncbi:MAG: hypothetical protein ACW99A_15715, partial [Candidatus Kariarchaeaceae archaeon]
SISWTVSDSFPSNYALFRNGIQVETGSWNNSFPVVTIVDNLAVGIYNFTLLIYDTTGNSNFDTVWVTVTDSINPLINSPPDTSYEVGATGNVLSWVATDNNPSIYTIYKDGVSFDSGTWSSGSPITSDVDGLTTGIYNFTIVISDTSSNSNNDTIFVTVNTDTTAPALSHPSDITYQFGTTGNEISWTVTDNNPNSYEIYRNGTIIDSGLWLNASPILISIDGLGINVYNFTIYLNDSYNNFNSDLVWVTVNNDIDPPVITPQGNITYQESTTGHGISWDVFDDNPDYFVIYKDGIEIDSGTWMNFVPITNNIDGLSIGTYNYTLFVNDTFFNSITNIVWVNVVNDVTTPTLNSPNDVIFEFGVSGNEISWLGTDLFPTTYEIYRDEILIDSGSWISGIAINISLSANLPVATYNYTISLYDVGNNFNSDLVWVTVQDTTVPLITSPNDFSYEYGITGYSVNWTATDLNPGTYFIYRNSVQVDTGTWLDSVPISISVEGLTIGTYNFTILILDNYNNPVSDEVFVTVQDTVSPIISSPNNITNEYGTIGNNISWTATDDFPANYAIFNNGIEVDSGSWTSGNPIIISIDALPLGLYNFTLELSDTSGNRYHDTVWVTVEDTILPSLTSPLDLNYEQGTTGHNISWTATDTFPGSYSIFKEGILVDSGFWSNGTPIVLDIDGYIFGIYNITIIIFDSSGNTFSDLVWVTITDNTNPTVSSPNDLTYEYQSTGNIISWMANDLNPDNYVIYRNGLSVASGSWSSGIPITIDIDSLNVNSYNFTIVLIDLAGNVIADTVIIDVVDTTDPTVNNPSDFSYEEETSGNNITWIATDFNPLNYFIYRDGIQIASGFWSSGSPIVISVDGLPLGSYNFTGIFSDSYGNTINNTVWVTVIDTIAPIHNYPSNVTYEFQAIGNTITWIPTDLNPNNYVIFENSIQIDSGVWFSGHPIITDIDNLAIGMHNYTSIFTDTSSNSIIYTCWVTVVDTSAPIINNPNNLTYEMGTTGNNISWTATDLNPDIYYVFRNNNQIIADFWTSNNPVTVNADNLSLGTYNYTISFWDAENNSNSHTIWITVVDTTAPDIISPGNLAVEFGTSGNKLGWTITDLNPDYYKIFKDSNIVDQGFWVTNVSIFLTVDGLSIGNYNYTIVANDTSNNVYKNEMWLTVHDTFAPGVIYTGVETYEEGSTGNFVSWVITDLNPDSYIIEMDYEFVEGGSWTSGTTISLNIDGLEWGVYGFNLTSYDSYSNGNSGMFYVRVSRSQSTTTTSSSDVTTSQIPSSTQPTSQPQTSEKPTTAETSGFGIVFVLIAFSILIPTIRKRKMN